MELDKEKKDQKEIRTLPVSLEIRETTNDDEDSSTRTITGAIKYETDSAEMRDWWDDVIVEQIASGAFSESLKNRNVVGLWSHDTGQVLGNTKSGTLRVFDGQKELRFELDLPNTRAGDDAFESIRRGDVDGVSFGMRVTKDKWSTEERGEGDKIYRRTILDAELYEISPVAFPAYPSNEVSARSLEEFKAEEQREKLEHEKEELLMELDLI